MLRNFLVEYVFPHISTGISMLLTGLLGFAFGKRKQLAEVKRMEVDSDGVEIDNVEKVVGVYQKSLDDLERRYDAKFREVSSFYEEKMRAITGLYEEKIKLMQDEISSLKRTVKLLKEENMLLKNKLAEV